MNILPDIFKWINIHCQKLYIIVFEDKLILKMENISMTNTNIKIVITGASSGIGEAIALEMAQGNTFYLTGRNKDRLEDVQEQVMSLGGNAFISVGDVSNLQDVKRQYNEAIEKLGVIDVLIPNAGVGYMKNLEETSDEEFNQMMGVNVHGVFYWIREVLPAMKERNKGQIIVMSSTAGLYNFSEASVYCASKHAVQSLAQAMTGILEVQARNFFADEISARGGTLRVGLYSHNIPVNNVNARLGEFLDAIDRYPFIKEDFEIHPERRIRHR